jgi:hypothetical protein
MQRARQDARPNEPCGLGDLMRVLARRAPRAVKAEPALTPGPAPRSGRRLIQYGLIRHQRSAQANTQRPSSA